MCNHEKWIVTPVKYKPLGLEGNAFPSKGFFVLYTLQGQGVDIDKLNNSSKRMIYELWPFPNIPYAILLIFFTVSTSFSAVSTIKSFTDDPAYSRPKSRETKSLIFLERTISLFMTSVL